MNRIDPRNAICLVILTSFCLSACASQSSIQNTPIPSSSNAPPGYEEALAKGAFSPDKRIVAIASDTGTAVYDVQTKSLRGKLDNGQGPPPTFVFSADSKFLIVARSAGYPIALWQLEPNPHLIFSKTSVLDTEGVALSSDNKLLAILGWDGTGSSHYLGGTLRIWDVSSGQVIREFPFIYTLQGFSPDSSEIVVSICTLPESICGATGIKRLSIYP